MVRRDGRDQAGTRADTRTRTRGTMDRRIQESGRRNFSGRTFIRLSTSLKSHVLQPNVPQAQSIGNNRYRAQTHRGSR